MSLELKDIVNRDLHTLTDCAAEPIHVPGSIQPHGCLLAVDPLTGEVAYCSANLVEFGMPTPSAVISRPLASVDAQLAAWLSNALDHPQQRPFLGKIMRDGHLLDIRGHDSGSLFLLELQRSGLETLQPDEIVAQTARFNDQIDQAGSLVDLCQRVACDIRELTGYDRVMIYRFDPEYNGEVYAESRHPELEAYLGLHYPHTDIPVQARQLYLRTLVRMIPNVFYEPVPILTSAAKIPIALDLSEAPLRSVSPIHIQYLKNMQVASTLTVSLVLDGRLWGLIACHHRTPWLIDHSRRQSALMQGYFLTSQVRVRLEAEEYAVHLQVNAHLEQLLTRLLVEEDFAAKFAHLDGMLPLAGAGGVAICRDGELFTKGRVPSNEQIRALAEWLSTSVKGTEFCSAALVQRYPKASAMARQASGVLYHVLGRPGQDYMMWMRPEWEATINWAGNPKDAGTQKTMSTLGPRTSFAVWQEQVKGRSRDWKVAELQAAARFAAALQHQFHVEHIQQEELRQRQLNEQLRQANAELANVNWIATHDLKEPLRKIQLFASRLIGQEGEQVSQHVIESVAKIHQSAARMQQLVQDILSFSMLSDRRAALVTTQIESILQEVLDAFKQDDHTIEAQSEPMPAIPAVPHQIRQLFTNLIGNSIKYTKPGQVAQVYITAERQSGQFWGEVALQPDRQYWKVSVRDNGIGFDQQQATKLFNIFYRLHGPLDYPGTGIGLAICRKIMDNHHGLIRAIGHPGEGSTFEAFFPAD